jgi:DNA-binding IscR family transcriptional regulator
MRLTEKTEIAIRIIKLLLENESGIQFPNLLPVLARDGVCCCEDFIRSILCALVKRGFVASSRGRMGGYFYFGPMQLSVWELICAVENEVTVQHSYVGTILKKYLKSIYVQDLVDHKIVSFAPTCEAVCQSL